MVIIDIVLMPAAVRTAIAQGRRSRPKRRSVVSSRREVEIPLATMNTLADIWTNSIHHLLQWSGGINDLLDIPMMISIPISWWKA